MADYRKPTPDELAKWVGELEKPGMSAFKDFPPWGLYQFRDAPGIRHTIIEYFPHGMKFKCGSCEEDHFVPGPAVGVMRSARFNLLPPGHDGDHTIIPVSGLEPADLPKKNEPVGIAGSAWAQ